MTAYSKKNIVKPEQRPPVNNDNHFQVPLGTFITQMISEQLPPVNSDHFLGS